MQITAVHLIEALIAGGFVGAVLGYIGAGGAMLSVPILIYIFHFSAHEATVAALAIVFLAAVSGVIPKFAEKNVLIREALTIWALGLITNIGATRVVHHLSDATIVTGFSVVLIVAGLSMLQKPIRAKPERRMPLPILILVSLVIGAMTGLFGIGGGFLAIPVLVLFFNTPQNKAAGTSLFIIALNCLTAFIGHYSQWNTIAWTIPLLIAGAAIIVSRLASQRSASINPALLRKSFAVFLFAISLFTLVHTWLT